MSALVTGLGVIAANGAGAESFWKATLAGECGIRRLERYDTDRYPAQLAGQVPDFVAAQHLPSRLLPQTDRVTRLALVAADWALADAGIESAEETGYDDFDMGVVTSNGSGGFEFTHTEINKLWTQGPERVSVYESFAWFYAANTGQISIRNGMRGPSGVLVADQAGGLEAIGQARRNLRRGTKLMLTGGVESSFDPWGWVSHFASGQVCTDADPATAYLPFDAAAHGYVPGEGGAILVLEQADAARARGVTGYGRVAGYAATFDPPPSANRSSNLARAMELALADAEVTADQVDVVFADAAGLPERDRAEADAITKVFGPTGVPVSAVKAGNGRLCAGGGPLDVATALLAMRDGVVPPTPHVTEVPDEYRLDLVLQPRTARLDTALVVARGRGGFNAALVLTKS
jgi:act minimal PKS chain-length factor (CLF/KS beta)